MALYNFIPNFDGLYEKVCEFVRDNQGEKGYIDTQNNSCDTIYSFAYEGDTIVEIRICGIKYYRGDLLIAYDPVSCCMTVFGDQDFREGDCWESLKYGDTNYVWTLLNIAESLEEYVE